MPAALAKKLKSFVTGRTEGPVFLAHEHRVSMRHAQRRACGRVPDGIAETTALDISLPNLRTAASCAAAIDKITAAVTAGAIDLATAKALADIVGTRLKAIEVNDLEQRLVELEKQANTVDFGGRRN